MSLADILLVLAIVLLVFGIYRFKKAGLELPPRDPWAH